MVASEEQKGPDGGTPRVIAPADELSLDDPRRPRDRRSMWRGILLSTAFHAAIVIALVGLWQWAPPRETVLRVALVTEGPGAAGASGGAGGEAATAGNGAADGAQAGAPAASSTAPPSTATEASAPAAPVPLEPSAPEPAPPEPTPSPPAAAATEAAPAPPVPAPALAPPKPTPPRPRHKPRATAPPTAAPAAPSPPNVEPEPAAQPTQAAPPTAPTVPQEVRSPPAGDKGTAAPAAAGTGTGPAGPGGVGQGTEGRGHGLVGNGPQDGPGDDYLDRLRHWLARYKKYPEDALKRKVEGEVVVAFTLARDGTVLSAQVEKSSGNLLLDRAAVQMLHDASPVPPVPERYKGRELRLTIPVDYSIGFFDRLFR